MEFEVKHRRYEGHEPGETFNADEKNPAIRRALERGSIARVAARGPLSSEPPKSKRKGKTEKGDRASQ